MKQMSKESVSFKQASAIAAQLRQMLKEIENMATEQLLSFVPHEEQTDIYVKVKIHEVVSVNLCLYNNLTNAVVIKQYSLTDLLRQCSNIFNVTSMVDTDTKELYNKSKEKVFKQNTVVII